MATFELKVTRDTIFKQSTADSETLPNDQETSITTDTTYVLSAFADAGNNHFKITLVPPTQIGQYNTWFVYKPDVSITTISK